jgi:hypothetical protein
MTRVRFITHEGKKILSLDLAHCASSEVQEVMRTLPDSVSTQARNSVLILADFTGAHLDEEALRSMQQAAVFNKPYVKKSAWLASAGLPSGFLKKMENFSRREFPLFSNREAALSWLIED